MEPNFPGMQALRNENDCSNPSCKICFPLKVMVKGPALVSHAIPFNELSFKHPPFHAFVGVSVLRACPFHIVFLVSQLLSPPRSTSWVGSLFDFLLYSSSPATTPSLSFQELLRFLSGHESGFCLDMSLSLLEFPFSSFLGQAFVDALPWWSAFVTP